MSIEREFKAGLTPDQAQAITAAFAFGPAFSQHNLYFDTPDFALAQRHMGLRIRQFEDYAEQTLKQPAAGQLRTLRETTDRLPEGTRTLLSTGTVFASLPPELAGAPLVCFAEATTTRRQSRQTSGLLVLDHTRYRNQNSDWELELEYQNVAAATAFWQRLHHDFGLSPAPVANKVARAAQNW